MNRRSFLQAILAVGMAPAILRAESLMKMVRRESGLIVPTWKYVSADAELDGILSTAWVCGPRMGDHVQWRRVLPYGHPSGAIYETFVTLISTPDELLRVSLLARSSRTALPSTSLAPSSAA